MTAQNNELEKNWESKTEQISCIICGMPDTCMVENINSVDYTLTSYLCTACGYTTNSELILGSLKLKTAIAASPKLVIDLCLPDNTRNVMWFPSTLNFPKQGVLYPDGTPEYWEWTVVPYILLTDEEKQSDAIKYENYTHRIAPEKAIRFQKDDFQSAINALKSMISGENE